jgi:hypothetical protein
MKPSIIPNDLTGKALFDFMVKNESLIIHAKKSEVKKADSIIHSASYVTDKGAIVSKADFNTVQADPTKLKVSVVINTTNFLDSHGDVHIPGLWKKSINDNKKNGFYLLKEHRRGFEDVIAESCMGETKLIPWTEIGVNMPGYTEALVFTGSIDKVRNEYMFSQYAKGYVKQHSVGMIYTKMLTCINDDDYPVQKENWDKYIEQVANRKEAEDEGYFWAVLEAKIVEGSAVLFGSNSMTPTLLVQSDSTKMEPGNSTPDEPRFNLLEAIKQTTFIKN